MNKVSSPSRRYVAMCNKTNFDGYYFRSFTLPEKDPESGMEYRNDTEMASWYFLNRLNFVACIEKCIAEEDFKKVEEQAPMFAKVEGRLL